MDQLQILQPFSDWVSDVLVDIPDETAAFIFNIYEEDDAYLVDITGTVTFDSNNEEWTDEINWDSGEELFIIPKEKFEGDWEDIHDALAETLEALIEVDNELSDALCDSDAVAIGFIDGDLEIIWQEQ